GGSVPGGVARGRAGGVTDRRVREAAWRENPTDAAATDMATERPMGKALLARSIVAGVVTALALVWLRSRPAPRGADAREVSLVEDLEVTLSDPVFTFGLDDGPEDD